MNFARRIYEAALAVIPQPEPDVIEWCRENSVDKKSGKSEGYDPDATPWTIEPLRSALAVDVRSSTLVKPIQTGGSRAGENFMLFVCKWRRGNLQINWEKDTKAKDRWKSRLLPMLENCGPLNLEKMDRHAATENQVEFGNVFLKNQGVFSDDNLDSETIHYQLNEEVHSWKPGHLAKANGRLRMIWNGHQFNISNAGMVNDQLHEAFKSGTMQQWELLCLGCGKYHVMRTRWEPERPQLGGLRYNADGCRIGKDSYNYNKLESTIFYQMPCGYRVENSKRIRKQLSMSGRYSAPTNSGAKLSVRSYIYDSVIDDSKDWLKDIIVEKHKALRARKYGDIQPWRRYVQEIECNFYSSEDAPSLGTFTLTEGVKKSREGLLDRAARLFSLDYQKGNIDLGETRHWWLVIRDFKADGNSMLVYEGKIDTDAEVEAVLKEHNCQMDFGVVDSGWDTKHIYDFAYRLGINVIKVGSQGRGMFQWDDGKGGGEHIYSDDQWLWQIAEKQNWRYKKEMDAENTDEPLSKEPVFFHVHYNGMRDLLWWFRSDKAKEAGIKHEAPEDVSEDYKAHQEAEQVKVVKNTLGVEQKTYEKLKARNDQLHNEACIVLLARKLGIPAMEE